MFEDYTESFRDDFERYIKWINDQEDVMTDKGYTCYVQDNLKIAGMIPKDKIVVDVGCSFGLQHVLYKDHKGWIGIQKFKEGFNCTEGFKPIFKTFTNNARIIEGMLKDVYQQIGITEKNKDQYFGVANHSLWHDPSVNKEDIDIFKRLFPQNYYATDEAGQRIKYDV